MNCSTPHKSCAALGIGAGLFTAMASALYTVFARMGLHEGLTPYDITFLRYCVAAVVTAPVLLLTLVSINYRLRRPSVMAVAATPERSSQDPTRSAQLPYV